MSNDNLALLATVAYAKITDISNSNIIQRNLTDIELSTEQAKKFTDIYDIIAHKPNTSNGYSGTIVKNKKTNEMFVLHRGTEVKTGADWLEDGILVTTGLPYRQLMDAKAFVDENIRNGNIKGNFINVGHSLGKSLSDLVHFTTDRSKGSMGFNGAGSSFLGDKPGINFTNPLTIPTILNKAENRNVLSNLAKKGGNTFNSNKDGVINFVSNGPSLVASTIPYNQLGKVISFDNGTFGRHEIGHFIEPMEYAMKLKGKYNLSLEESVGFYNTARLYYNTFEFGMLFDKPHNKVSGVLDDFINKNRSINREKLETFIKQSFLEDDKYHYRKQIPWPEPYTGNTTPTNKFSFTPSSEIAKNKTQDFDYFSATRTLSLGFNKEALNKSTKTSDLASSSIITDDTRIANHNLVILKSIDIANYVVSNLPGTNHVKLNRAQGKPFKIAIDPLILDLNGDGARTVSYIEKPVLFDIDNDGGSLEETGWLNNQDGLLVRDLNNNGKIDNMSEVFSEYYAGKAGRNGESGEKRFKNGFEALKTLDSNKDNVFDSKDRDFNSVRVWQDANHNGITDSGELKTLSSLKITAIDLVYQEAGGQLFFGNELLARGYFTRNGKKHEAAAVNFLANPRGHTITNVSGGKKTVTEAAGVLSQTSSFTAEGNQARTLEAKKLGVINIQAGDGNDTLRGDELDNWLAGGAGSDTFFGGDGDDVLLIDGDDLPENIHGGKGDDIVQVVGDKPVSLDLGKAEIEIAHGGRGNDTFVSSGNSSVFVRGGDGNDVIVGSIANDALSGENGDDFISGNAGKDLIRGHRGNDRLFGDDGDDVIFGGSDDDLLYGGQGNDTLLGEGGDDYLDGGEGLDIAEFSGNFADYKITKMGDGILVSDKTQGRDGTDFLRNIEMMNFKDITGYAVPTVNLEWENPTPVEDILYQDSKGQAFDGSRPYIIKPAQLLKNDIDLQGDKIIIYQASNIRGGTIKELPNGDIEFTPAKGFKGIASFEYSIKDSKGTKAIQTAGSGELTGKVYLVPPSLPSDPDVIRQYYLEANNIAPVWNHYTGKKIRIGQFEPSGPFSVAEEVADYRHPELRNKIDKTWLHNYEYKRQEEDKVFSKHATEVAGIMVAERNGEGGVGVAYDATVASYWVGADVSSLDRMKNYDIANHSWGHTQNFKQQISFADKNKTIFDIYKPALTDGRNGLGTVIVNSAGNDRQKGGNTNYSELTNVRYGIAVASAERNRQFETKIASYSNQGASVLVTAYGSDAYSSSREIVNENGSTLGQEYARNNGTSFSAPIVSGVVALMLEANPYLGYRDIQEILALTATTEGITDSQWQRNGAKNWNGTGMHISHDYGYGVIDAQAAVRLAQDWNTQHTYENEVRLEDIYKSGKVNQAITDNNGRQFAVNVSNVSMLLENVAVKVNLTHARASDLIIKLISPSGTESILMNRPGKDPNDDNAIGDVKFGESSTLNYTFNTTLLKGENPNGQWKLQFFDVATGSTGMLHDWSLSFYGRAYGANDTYVYTDEFHNNQAIDTLNDTNGGIDTINAAAMDGVIEVNLSTGKAKLAGKALTITNPQQIENVTGGDYNDKLTGNNAVNVLIGGRGNDTLIGLDGNDVLAGGLGTNTLTGGNGSDTFIIEKKLNSQDVITDFSVGTDRLVFTGFNTFNLSKQQQGKDTVISLGNAQTVRLNNVQADKLTNNNIVVTKEVFKPYWLNQTGGYGFSNNNAEIALPDFGVAFWGTEGEDRIFGGNGNDILQGGSGNDIIVGEHSADSDTGGNDILYGNDGDDRILGGGGNDILQGGVGSDYLGGGAGNDILYLEGDDTALASTYRDQQYTTLNQYNNVEFSWARAEGGKGSDRFVVVKDASQNASKGLLKNLIWDFDINDKNEKIDISQFKGVNTVNFYGFRVNNEQYTRIWLGEPKVGTQYVTVKGIRPDQLKAEMFIFSKEQAELPQLVHTIVGTNGNDTLKGNAIGNLIDGRSGADSMSGEFGDDTYIVDNVGDKVLEIKDGGYDIVKSSVSYALSNYVEEIQLMGNASINATGNSENNRLVGNSGNNRLDGKAGFDTMIGGLGNDTYIVDSHLDKVIEKTNQGIDTVISSVSYTLPENVENVELVSKSHISATGNDTNNTLKGNSGNNRLIGYGGNDSLNGMGGNDFLMGGLGNDTYHFNRGDGMDTIYDEQGNDTLRFTNINHNQLWFRKLNVDLEVSVIGTQDKVVISDWYGKNYKVENFVAANNKSLNHTSVDKLVSAMAAFSPPSAGQISLPQAVNTKLEPILAANWT
ncbi:S8 family serine peptidase [Mannheimia haemolytica]|uniref:S8 family serine peptidase n=1 Tax=Mannheimia haemolytica TaxID=75985 RepID=UPI002EB9252F|nr:S8 family serine peptidase [Mannheimia haemolytica]